VITLLDDDGMATGDSVTVWAHFYDETTGQLGYGSFAISELVFEDDTLTGPVEIVPTRIDGGLVYGTAGNDVLNAPSDAGHWLLGGSGNDTLNGGAGADLLDGDTGDDTLAGGAGDDELADENGGSDTYIYRYGLDGFDLIYETDDGEDPTGEDTLKIYNVPANASIEFMVEGDRDLFIQVGDDPEQGVLVEGFFGDSGWPDFTPVLDGDVENIILYSDNGTQQLLSYSSADLLLQFFGNGSATDGYDTLTGTTGADVLAGGQGPDWLQGDDGNDELYGGDGDDQLEGGGGNDTLQGWEGDITDCP